jgi:hypothetical protein
VRPGAGGSVCPRGLGTVTGSASAPAPTSERTSCPTEATSGRGCAPEGNYAATSSGWPLWARQLPTGYQVAQQGHILVADPGHHQAGQPHSVLVLTGPHPGALRSELS